MIPLRMKYRNCRNGRGTRAEQRRRALIPAVLSAAFVLVGALIKKHPDHWWVWATLIGCAALVFIVAVYRLSPPERRK